MHVGGGVAKLTLPHLNKDDEGLYTLRIWTKKGTTEHSAYLFVKGLLQMCTFSALPLKALINNECLVYLEDKQNV